jgi:hypothetical protein
MAILRIADIITPRMLAHAPNAKVVSAEEKGASIFAELKLQK